jgi:ABC-type glycerol-3-phosphate transport system substrate-binding protein
MAGGALAACAPAATSEQGEAGPGSAATSIVWMNPDVADWQPAYQEMTAEFMAQNSSIQVEIQNVPESGFLEKITSMIAGNTGPDVWVCVPRDGVWSLIGYNNSTFAA